MQETHARKMQPRLPTCTDLSAIHDSAPHTRTSAIGLRSNRSVQTSDFRDIYLNRIAEKVNQYLSGCVPVEKYGT